MLLKLFNAIVIAQLCVSATVAQEPATSYTAPWSTIPIPEPLLYDMALPLGTERGQLEVNSIFRVPTGDGKVISVPEIEGTVLDGLGLEMEIEFEDDRQTGWNTAAQLTLGRAFNQQFIHGLQFIVERDDSERTTEIVALYISGYRFSPVWSTLLMAGVREPVSGGGETRFVFNGSVFATTSDRITFGIELNSRADVSRTDKLQLIPQIHWTASDHISVQAGIGMGKENEAKKSEVMLRAIYAF